MAEVAGLLGYARPRCGGGICEEALFYAWGWTKRSFTTDQWFRSPDNQRGLKEFAVRFVNEYIRQNTSELIERIDIVEHEDIVEHAAEERLIYRQACHDQGLFDLTEGYKHLNLNVRAELLKRCAHFDMGEAAESTLSAVDTLGNLKRDRVEKLEQQVWVEVARAISLRLWDSANKRALCSRTEQYLNSKALMERVTSALVEDVEHQLRLFADCVESTLWPLQQSLRVAVKTMTEVGAVLVRPKVCLLQPIPDTEHYRDDRQRHAIVHAVA